MRRQARPLFRAETGDEEPGTALSGDAEYRLQLGRGFAFRKHGLLESDPPRAVEVELYLPGGISRHPARSRRNALPLR